jgi:hypothetical protein
MSASGVESNTLSTALTPSGGNNDPSGNTVDGWNFAFNAAKAAQGASTRGSQSVSQGARQHSSDYLNQTRCIGLCHGFDPGMKPLATPHQLLPLHLVNLAATLPIPGAGEVQAAKEFNLLLPGGTKGIFSSLSNEGVVSFIIEAGKGSPVSGTEMVAKMLAAFGNRATAMQGNWTYGVNLAKVNELTASGMSLEQAVTKTWTASRAAMFGFEKAAVQLAEGSPGAYTKLRVLFTR